ncbi:MAG TPA: response regulator transcription factor [Motilibacteraceae bacterium]|nr:response regulator transcription factor [Motilibacteraceae bacterium]
MDTSRRLRVLVVDDHAAYRLALAGVLRRAGDLELVGEAASGEEALDRARELAPDVVVLDVRMPGIGGIAAAARLRAQHPDVLVLLCSSYDLADLPVGVLEAGIVYAPKEEVGPGLLRRLWQQHRAEPAAAALPEPRPAENVPGDSAPLTPPAAPPPA